MDRAERLMSMSEQELVAGLSPAVREKWELVKSRLPKDPAFGDFLLSGIEDGWPTDEAKLALFDQIITGRRSK